MLNDIVMPMRKVDYEKGYCFNRMPAASNKTENDIEKHNPPTHKIALSLKKILERCIYF